MPAATSRHDVGLLLLRLGLGMVLLFHGAFKLTHGVGWIEDILTGLGLPTALAYGTYVAELLAPVLVILGVRARLAALVIAVDMGAAIALVLRPRIFSINQGGGGWGIELEALILVAALALSLTGPGGIRVGTRASS
ncbi:MAG: DoxX family protein [Gemmatimonadetes bacterium]|nr:DoxX family protein [Gemmatimonadota bacterium]